MTLMTPNLPTSKHWRAPTGAKRRHILLRHGRRGWTSLHEVWNWREMNTMRTGPIQRSVAIGCLSFSATSHALKFELPTNRITFRGEKNKGYPEATVLQAASNSRHLYQGGAMPGTFEESFTRERQKKVKLFSAVGPLEFISMDI